jgi:putative inorganic carbon (HCO3(-)) transporter
MKIHKPYLEEEKPLLELPALLVLLVVFASMMFGLSLLVLPPIIVFLAFLAFCIGVAIIFNPFIAIPVFIIGAYTHPVAFFPTLAPYHPTTIFAAYVLLAWGFHIMLYKDFGVVKSKQVLYMFLFGLMVFVSSLFHWQYSSYAFIDFIKILILYFVVVHLVNSRFRVSILISLLIPLGALVAFYALYLQATGVGRGSIAGAMRVVSFEGNPNYLSLSLAMLVPLLFGMFISQKSKIIKIILGSFFILFSTVIILTYSRSGFLGFVIVLALAVRKFFARKNKILVFIILAVGSLVFLLYAPPQFYERIESITNLQDPSIVGRLDVYRVGSLIALKHPIIGVGLGTYSFGEEYFNIAITMPNITNKFIIWAHNVFLEIGAKIGIIALIFFILILFYALRDIRETQKIFSKKGDNFLLAISQSLEVAIVGYVVFAMFATSLTLKIFWILLAMTAALRQIAFSYENNVSANAC